MITIRRKQKKIKAQLPQPTLAQFKALVSRVNEIDEDIDKGIEDHNFNVKIYKKMFLAIMKYLSKVGCRGELFDLIQGK